MSEINFGQYKLYEGIVTLARYNRLLDVIQRVTLNSGPNYRIKRTAAGTTLVTTGSGGIATPCPFTVIVRPGTDGDQIANVTAGTVNGLLPSNNFDDFSFDPTEVIQVKAHALTDGQAVTSSTLVIDDTAPAVQEPTSFALPAAVDVLIAVIVNGTPYRVLGCGSIQLTGTQQFITSPSPPASPGTPNYVPWYSWTVGTV